MILFAVRPELGSINQVWTNHPHGENIASLAWYRCVMPVEAAQILVGDGVGFAVSREREGGVRYEIHSYPAPAPTTVLSVDSGGRIFHRHIGFPLDWTDRSRFEAALELIELGELPPLVVSPLPD